MNWRFSLFFIALTVIASAQLAHGGVYADNPYVSLEATLLPDSARSGDTVELLLVFSPGIGIHISAKPQLVFTLDTTLSASLAGPPVRVVDGATGFLSTASPVRQAIRLQRALKRGPYTLRGIVSYYYCSDSDGWCMKFRQQVEVSLLVTE